MTNGLRFEVGFQCIELGWSVITLKVGGDRYPKTKDWTSYRRRIGLIQETLRGHHPADSGVDFAERL